MSIYSDVAMEGHLLMLIMPSGMYKVKRSERKRVATEWPVCAYLTDMTAALEGKKCESMKCDIEKASAR